MTKRSRVTPKSRTYNVSRRTLAILDRLALEFDLPRGKIADIALRMFSESGKEIPQGYGETSESPTRLRLSARSVKILRRGPTPQPAVLEAAVEYFQDWLREHSELPLRFLISGAGSIARKAMAVNA